MKSTLFFLILFFYFSVSPQSAQIRLNEIVASNSSIIADEDGDYEDWIELYNYGSEIVNLEGFGLSDDYDRPFRWIFPNISLAPDEYLIVWASGKDRRFGELHSNFSISSSGEEVILTTPDGERIDELSSRNIPNDISVGRVGDDNQSWYYFKNPTPSQENIGDYYLGLLDPPQFSHKGGFYTEEFILTLSSNVLDATIYYTLDGSEPNPDNLEGSFYHYKNSYPENPGDSFGEFFQRDYRTYSYDGIIKVNDKTGMENPQAHINSMWKKVATLPREAPLTGTVIRAITVVPGYLPSEIVTHTYIVSGDIETRYHVPVISIVTPEKGFFDYDTGIYVAGRRFDDWRINNMQSTSNYPAANFRLSGHQWERSANIEFFDATGDIQFSHMCGIRIHGGWTRRFSHKSLRLYARGEYGQSRFEHQFFSSKETSTFNRLLLRNSGNDNRITYFRDALMQNLVQGLKLDQQHYEPIILFLNGEYWGIHNIRDRVDKHFLHYEHGVNPDEIDILEKIDDVKEGSNQHYVAMLDFMINSDMSDMSVFDSVNTMMDIDNYINYHSSQVFFRNTDWPENNIDFWRYQTDEYKPDAPYGHDGRWRWILYDTDFGFGIWNYTANHNSLARATEVNRATRLFRLLLRNQKFKHNYINRHADHMNTIFHPQTVIHKIDSIQNHIAPLYNEHSIRWRAMGEESWENEVEKMRIFARQRPGYMKEHLKGLFDLTGTYNLSLSVGFGLGGYNLNSLKIRNRSYWQGVYFNDIPVKVEAVAEPGYVFSHWESDGEFYSDSIVLEVTTDENLDLQAIFVEAYSESLIHYWHFNLLEDQFDTVYSDYSQNSNGFLYYHGQSQGYMDLAQGTLINAIDAIEPGNSLRVRNPAQTRTLIIDAPTTGFKNIEFSYAVQRTNNGATLQSIYYNVDSSGNNWILLEDNIVINLDFELKQFDLSNIKQAENNPNFKLLITFDENASSLNGNNRFDNLILSGDIIEVSDFIINVDYDKSLGDIFINGNRLNKSIIDSIFRYSVVLILRANSKDLINFEGWKINDILYPQDNVKSIFINENMNIEAIFKKQNRHNNFERIYRWDFENINTKSGDTLVSDYSFYVNSGLLTTTEDFSIDDNYMRFNVNSDSTVLILDISTEGFSEITADFSIKKFGQSSVTVDFYYSDYCPKTWIKLTPTSYVKTNYENYYIDLTPIKEVEDNSNMKMKVVFKKNESQTPLAIEISQISVLGKAIYKNMWLFLENGSEVAVGYPNPFKTYLKTAFYLDKSYMVEANIYDLLGKVIYIMHNGKLEQGRHEFKWTPKENVSSGVYVLRVKYGNRVFLEKLYFKR